MKLPKFNSTFDLSLIILPLLLVIASIATLYSITSVSGKLDLVYNQLIFAGLGAVAYVLFAVFDYREMKRYAYHLYFIGLFLLIAADIFGMTVFGSRRWINLGFFQIQPSEIMKLFFIFVAARFFSGQAVPSTKRIVLYLAFLIVPIVLILKEPDLGTALSIGFAGAIILFYSKVSKKFIIGALVALIVLSPVVYLNLKPYQKQRVTSFINPESDPLKTGYNVSQAKIAVGSGGLMGKGFSGATQSQLQFLPVAHVDFIFSGWAEATGFIGSIALVLVFAILIYRIFAVSLLSKDRFGFLICVGFGSLIFFQALVNIGMNIGIMPVTGIPLPFVSSGGTSFLTNSIFLGVVQSIYIRQKGLRFD